MENLYDETVRCMMLNGLLPMDIMFIGSPLSGHTCTWQEFIKLANREYNTESDIQRVASDLIILFKNGATMIRRKDKNSEWWQTLNNIQHCPSPQKIKSLFSNVEGYNSLEEIQLITINENTNE